MPDPLNRYPHMVHEHYVARVRDVLARRRERLGALRSRADAEAYVRRTRLAARRCFGPFPPRCPLDPVVTGRDDYPGYTLEKVLFQSRPGMLVPGLLYLPRRRRRLAPGVLGLCGHAPEGKAAAPYQSFCQGLALRGFVVFIIDPLAQGERVQHDVAGGEAPPDCCVAHNMAGNQMALCGDFLGTWRVHEAIRALDYLLSRPEVDGRCVGVTGNSGGGTLCAYVAALDPRPAMVAPSCFICSYQANLESELPADAEQNPPGILGAGMDQVDLLACHAPRPTLLLAQQDDYFSAAHARVAAAELARLHRLLGSRDAAIFVGPRSHGYHVENREAMYAFFMRHAGIAGGRRERGVAPVERARLSAAPAGDTRAAGSRLVFDFIRETSRSLAGERGRPPAAEVARHARRLLGLRRRSRAAPPHRVLAHYGRGDASDPLVLKRQYAVESEPGIQVLVSLYGPPHPHVAPPKGHLEVYLGHVSGQTDVQKVPEVRERAKAGRPFLVVDPRGLGQSLPDTCNATDPFGPYASDFLHASTGEMLGESYLGRRVHDVLAVLDWLRANGAGRTDLSGRGFGAVIAAFAGLLHPSRPRVRLLHYLPSYSLLAGAPLMTWPLSCLPRGVLRHFDLPDVYRALGRRLTLQAPWNAAMRPLDDGRSRQQT